MELKQVTKIAKKKENHVKVQKKKIYDDNVMLANCNIVVIFPTYGQFGTLWKLGSDAWFVKLTFSLRVTFYLAKTATEIKISYTAPVLLL